MILIKSSLRSNFQSFLYNITVIHDFKIGIFCSTSRVISCNLNKLYEIKSSEWNFYYGQTSQVFPETLSWVLILNFFSIQSCVSINLYQSCTSINLYQSCVSIKNLYAPIAKQTTNIKKIKISIWKLFLNRCILYIVIDCVLNCVFQWQIHVHPFQNK